MTTEKKPKAIRYTSPKGIFRYPALVKPDYGTKDFPKPNGEFKVQLILDEADAEVQAFIAKVQKLHDAAVAKGAEEFKKLKVEQRKKLKELSVTDLFQTEYDKETEEPTGNIIFKFSTTASGKNAKGEEWSRKVPLFDAKGKPLTTLKAVGGGTLGKVSFEAAPYFVAGTGTAGVKFYLCAAQILELKTFSGGSSGDYGFGAEEGYDGIEDDAGGDFGDESGEGSSDDAGSAPQDDNEDF